jgi:glycosyltransferase involved in cell wall biosynthesis
VPTILLDVTRLIDRLYAGLVPTGIDRVGLAYIERYGTSARAVLSERGFVTILSQKDSQRVFSWLMITNRNRSAIRNLIVRAVLQRPWEKRVTDGVLLHTSHSGLEYRRYYESMKRRQIRTVFMVHDLIPLTHPEYCRPGVDAIHRRRMHTAFAHADGLIANSQATLMSMSAEADHAGIPLPVSVVAPLATGFARSTKQAAPLMDSPYFIMLGTIEPRKNHWFMLHLWRQLSEKYGSAAPKLVVIGRRGWECENVVDMLDRCNSLRHTVVEENNCSDEKLDQWLQHARALLFPSFVEGYGMPLAEALAARVPVIASDLSVFREIAQDIPDYLDPLDGPGWISRIESYSRDDSVDRTSQLDRIQRFREPTWDEHFRSVDSLIGVLRR